eukprot:6213175-Pleurochrysis_carterae.AAC.6
MAGWAFWRRDRVNVEVGSNQLTELELSWPSLQHMGTLAAPKNEITKVRIFDAGENADMVERGGVALALVNPPADVRRRRRALASCRCSSRSISRTTRSSRCAHA